MERLGGLEVGVKRTMRNKKQSKEKEGITVKLF